VWVLYFRGDYEANLGKNCGLKNPNECKVSSEECPGKWSVFA
jgi:hypothetical protein